MILAHSTVWFGPVKYLADKGNLLWLSYAEETLLLYHSNAIEAVTGKSHNLLFTLKVLFVGGLGQLFWHDVWSLQGFEPLVRYFVKPLQIMHQTGAKQSEYGKPKLGEVIY